MVERSLIEDVAAVRCKTPNMEPRRTEDELGVAHSWGTGPEVIFLSSPLADPVAWSSGVRDDLLSLGYQVTTFEHRPIEFDWPDAVTCVSDFIARRRSPVALVGWSQGAAIAQEAARAADGRVRCAALLATYARQNEIDKILQRCWNLLATRPDDLNTVRLALGLLTAFPPEKLADDRFVQHMRMIQSDWAGRPDLEAKRRAATFISTYQGRLPELAELTAPCLIMGFELDTDTFAARAREVAQVIPSAEYVELPGLAHAAPITEPEQVWPRVVGFLQRHHPPN